MKSRLQTLWDEVSLEHGPCPQPDVARVQQRVNAALDGKTRTTHPRRVLTLALAIAAVLLLVTGTAVATEMLPEYNVLSAFFHGDTTPWENMVRTQPVSVSDDNYTLTLTSSVADKSTLFYTFTVQAHSDEAWSALQDWEGSWGDLWSFRPGLSLSMGGGGDIDPETRTMYLDVDTSRGWGTHAAVRLNIMDEGIWLKFSFKPVSDITLKINAEGPGSAKRYNTGKSDASITLKQLTLSPFTIQAKYTTPDSDLFPVLEFLWKDGAYTPGSSILGGSGTGHGSQTDKDDLWKFTQSYSFVSVLDLSQLEAVVFGGMAYSLDGSQPYEVDLTALTQRELDP